MNLEYSFQARFKTNLAGNDYFSEIDCVDAEELAAQKQKVVGMTPPVCVDSARICFDMARPDRKGCFMIEDATMNLFARVLEDLKIGTEHFMNETLGTYNPFRNRVTPADMGIVFPDGMMRLIWRESEAQMGLEESAAMINGAMCTLIKAQGLPYCKHTEDEYEECDDTGVTQRLTEVLFEAGYWPDEDGKYEPMTGDDLDKIMQKFAKKKAPGVSMATP